jgi:hypothetical protein
LTTAVWRHPLLPVSGRTVSLPFYEPAAAPGQPAPVWLVAGFTLDQAAGTTWTLAFGHRTPVLVYLDGRLLANSVPLPEADLPLRNLWIGERRLDVSVPAEWLTAGPHHIAVRVGAAGPSGASLTGLSLGPSPVMEAADVPRRFWLSLRVVTALSALVIGTLLLFAWLVERRERLFLWSGLQLWMLSVLLSPYVLDAAPVPAPWWRVLLDMADVLAKGLAPLVIAAWAAPHLSWVRRLAFGYLAVALPVDMLAAYHVVPWVEFSHPWPWWALGSRLAVLSLAVWVAARALREIPGLHRFGTLLLAGLALWIWIDVTLTAIVWPGRVAVVDLNVVAYAGWALWVGMLLAQAAGGQPAPGNPPACRTGAAARSAQHGTACPVRSAAGQRACTQRRGRTRTPAAGDARRRGRPAHLGQDAGQRGPVVQRRDGGHAGRLPARDAPDGGRAERHRRRPGPAAGHAAPPAGTGAAGRWHHAGLAGRRCALRAGPGGHGRARAGAHRARSAVQHHAPCPRFTGDRVHAAAGTGPSSRCAGLHRRQRARHAAEPDAGARPAQHAPACRTAGRAHRVASAAWNWARVPSW